jgi:hypothetical protein
VAPLPHNNTDLVYIDYVTGVSATSRQHTVQFRTAGGGISPLDVQDVFLDILNAIDDSLFRAGWRVTGVRSQGAGTNFSLPSAIIPALDGFVGVATGDYQAADEASEVTFQGRSPTSGRRVDFSLYTAVIGPGNNFRFLPSDPGLGTVVTNVLAVLTAASAAGIAVCIDGSSPQWYPYMNQNYNSYWETDIRG